MGEDVLHTVPTKTDIIRAEIVKARNNPPSPPENFLPNPEYLSQLEKDELDRVLSLSGDLKALGMRDLMIDKVTPNMPVYHGPVRTMNQQGVEELAEIVLSLDTPKTEMIATSLIRDKEYTKLENKWIMERAKGANTEEYKKADADLGHYISDYCRTRTFELREETALNVELYVTRALVATADKRAEDKKTEGLTQNETADLETPEQLEPVSLKAENPLTRLISPTEISARKDPNSAATAPATP